MSHARHFIAGLVVAVVVAALAVALLSGGDEDEPVAAGRAAPQQPAPEAPRTAIVPRGAKRVIEGWLAAVRRADFEKAGSYFAIPSRVQNGGPPETLDNPALAIAWNATLPCGAVLTTIQPGFDGFVVARFRLTERRNGQCGSGVGAPAASRIKVRDGRIVEWIRVMEEPAAPGVET